MPDISLCTSESCTLKETCYRYKAIPNHYYQSYSNFMQKPDGTCENYLDLDKQVNGDKPIKKKTRWTKKR